MGRVHFSGIGGAGMNPLAQLLAHRGIRVSGSDRAFDQGQNQVIQEILRGRGITLYPQDGSAIGPDIDRLIHSTAVERDTPELAAANQLGLTCVPRPALLAEVVAGGQPGLAVSGTSGKSSVVGMIAWILRQAQCPATVLGGAALAEDGAQHMGCFSAGPAAGPVVVEACESDGTLIGYAPALGLIHNITRDHAEVAELSRQFATFAQRSQRLLVNADDDQVLCLVHQHPNCISYGMRNSAAQWRCEPLRLGPWRSQGELTTPDGASLLLDIPQPGMHSIENGLAALVAAQALGVSPAVAVAALCDFPGVARRFQVLGRSDQGITVVDDYAHNGAKIAAALRAAQAGAERVLAIFQPHGFGPARFLRQELAEMLPQILRPGDRICYGEIFYAGGSVTRDISSADLAADLSGLAHADYAPNHLAIIDWVTTHAMPGDTILLMGARDPQLGPLAQTIFDLL
ncbi:MAG: UDP-N-acetylmuramate--alanine ligase [Planctomycetota bacterium]|nr:MAG: UDP-N-acetylmuramate--alanine ligase [Planctomycetota bacterium]